MESGGGLDVGHIFAKLDAKLDESNFKRFDAAVDKSKVKAKELGGSQKDLTRSTDQLSSAQAKQATSLRKQGDGWGSVAQKLGVSGKALRSYQSDLERTDAALKSHNKTISQTTREQDKVKKSTNETGREMSALESVVSRFDNVLKAHERTLGGTTREQEKFRTSTRGTNRDLTSMEGGISRLNRATTFFSNTLKLLKFPGIIAGLGLLLQGADAAAGGVVALTSALAPLSGLLVALPGVLGAAGQGLGVAVLSLLGVKKGVEALNAEQIKSGQEAEKSGKKQRTAAAAVTSAQEGVKSAHEGVTEALEGVRSANEGVRGAELGLSTSQRSVKDAQRELNQARTEAVKTLVDQRNAAIDAENAEVDSQLSLRRAIAELNKAEIDPKSSFLDIEELEQRVTEAKQGVKEARLESSRAQGESERAQADGVAKSPGVREANRQLAESHRGVAEAQRDVGKSHREVVKAQRGVTKAHHGVAKAQRGVSEAQRGGNEAMTETATSVNKVEEAFANLTPQGQKFSRFLFGLKPQLQDIQKTAAKGFLPGAETGIKSALKNLPVVQKVIGGTSRVLGNLTERAGKLFGSKGFGQQLEIVGKGNSKTLGLMGRSAEHLFKALGTVLVVAQPLLQWLGKMTNHFSAYVEKSADVNKKNGDLAKFFGETRQVVETLANTFGNLGGTLHVIGEEAAPLGREILSVFESSSEGLDEWAHSIGGRNSIKTYFEEVKEPLWEAGRLVHDITHNFFELGSGEGMKSLTSLLGALRTELLPVFTEVTKETGKSFGPHLIELITQVLGLFGRLSGGSGPLTLYVEALTAAGEVTNTLLDDVPGLKGIASNLLGIVAVMKTIEGLGKFTGITKGLELAFGKDFAGKLKGKLKTQVVGALKGVFLRGALAGNLVLSWGEGVASEAAQGIGKQVGKFKAVARKAVIAFISTFAPELGAEMAAQGSVGAVLSSRFPKVATLFEGGGKLAGKGFLIGLLIGAALIGVELGNLINKKFPDLGPSIRHWGIRTGESFVNGLIDAVNLGIKGINVALNKANILGKLGVSAPQIGEVGHVNWHSSAEREKVKTDKRYSPAGERSADSRSAQIAKEIREGKLNEAGQPVKVGPPAPTPTRSKSRRDLGDFHEDQRAGEEGARNRQGKKPQDEASDTRKKVAAQHKQLRQEVESETSKLDRGVSNHFTHIRKSGSEETHLLDKTVSANVKSMQGTNDEATTSMAGATSERFQLMQEAASSRSKTMSENVEHNIGEMDTATTEGMDHIQHATIAALKAFGVKNISLDLKGGKGESGSKGKPQKKAGGGVFTVPGEGLQDNVYLPGVNALVAPGEDLFAANRHQQPLLDYAVDLAYGTPTLDSFFGTFNKPHYAARGGPLPAPRRYRGGGQIVLEPEASGHMSQGVEPIIAKDLKALSAEIGKIIYVISGYRTPAHSVEVGGFADDPHTRGEAADIGAGSALRDSMFGVSDAMLNAVGLYRPFYPPDPNEVNHVQLLPGGAKGMPTGPLGASGKKDSHPAIKHLKSPKVEGTSGTFQTLAQAALDRTTQGANAFMDKKAGRHSAAASGGVGAGSLSSVPTGPLQKMAQEMVTQLFGAGQWGAFDAIEEREAGWNPRAENASSGAAGLAQALPSSKYPPGAWPYTGPKSGRLQLEWMMSYIKERYGTPAAAEAHEQSAGWYARGGRVGGPQRLAGGGAFKGNINKTYPGAIFGPETSAWEALPQLPGYVAASLAEAAGKYTGTGMPGNTMVQISKGEGDLKPGSRSTDDGWGWLAITRPYGDALGVPQMGGYPEMLNPVKNAYVAARMWGASSDHFGANGTWHGSSHVTDTDSHYTGAYDIRDALGGFSFKEAIKGRKSPGPESKASTTKKVKPQKPGAGRGHNTVRPYGTPAPKPKPKKHKGKRAPEGISSENVIASPPKGKYSPKAIARVVAQSGVGLPYGLTAYGNANGAPNWAGLPAKTYYRMVDAYYRKVAEYRQKLGEERTQAEENFVSNPLLTSVTALSASTISTALGYHPPAGPETAAYGAGYAALAGLDARAAGTRSSYLNTYSESYLAPYAHKETIAEYNKENGLAVIGAEGESNEFARAKLRGLQHRLKTNNRAGVEVNRKPKKKRAPKPNKKAPAKKKARGGRLGGFARRFAKGGKVKSGLGGAQQVGVKPSKVRAAQVHKVQNEVAAHKRKVARRGERNTKRVEERYEEESEGILTPVEREREELEEREAFETARREELVPLLNEIALNVQRTALVGSNQAQLFAAPAFARGGQIAGPVAPAAAPAAPAAAPSVSVPLGVHLHGGLDLLTDHIETVVDGKINNLGTNAGTARSTVSAPGRRVSYGGK